MSKTEWLAGLRRGARAMTPTCPVCQQEEGLRLLEEPSATVPMSILSQVAVCTCGAMVLLVYTLARVTVLATPKEPTP